MTVKLAGVRKLVAGTDGPGWFADFKGDPYQDLYELSRKMLPDMEKVRAFLSGNAARLLGV
jgi:predicted TIM-barrel fold metal-dependent hydrolase